MLFGIAFAISLNTIDSIFIKMVGTEQAAALQFSFPVIMLISSIAMGIGQGASAVISRNYGSNNMDKVKRLTTDSLIIAVILVALFVIIGFIFFDEIFQLQGASSTMMPFIKEYMYIWMGGMIFLVIPFLGNSALRAIGDTKTPSLIMMVAVLINGILDPIMIFGLFGFPRLELQGAAIATVIARMITLFASLYFLKIKYNMLSSKIFDWKEFKVSFKEIMEVGLPAAITSVVIPFGIFIVNGFVQDYGVEAMAALNVASRFEMISLVVFMALGSVLGPFIGQNFGANQTSRINDALKKSYIFSIVWGLLMIGLFYFIAEPLALFLDEEGEPKFVEYMIIYLSIIPFAISFRGINMLISTSFNVLKRPWYSMIISMSQMFILFIPLAFYFSNQYGYSGILWASVLASIITAIIGSIWLKSYFGKLFA
ncbi:MATE family efflux transporter [Candidatus Kapabacteria bacterium]|nr:MATE family efflux transporter [Candidatus Kapabacteria bacterium]